MTIIVRNACPEDADAIAEIASNSLGYPCDGKMIKQRMEGLDLQREKVLAAVKDQEVIGFIHCEKYCLLYEEDMINVHGLAVRTDMQGCGAGRKLLEAAEDWAKSLGFTAVRLNSSARRVEAHAFYEHLGYENTKMQKRFFKKVNHD